MALCMVHRLYRYEYPMPCRFAAFPICHLPELASRNIDGIRFVCSITFNLLIMH